ncbi:hypothetical protein Thiowin_02059 [Thiorhodovibrio winogradskyi]|uniref:Uncharacterized protein n=1 Tax=Thiorhodovibrio winogradskyi TaxID=77007 RepID=A0ABZ0S8W3_9GAMM
MKHLNNLPRPRDTKAATPPSPQPDQCAEPACRLRARLCAWLWDAFLSGPPSRRGRRWALLREFSCEGGFRELWSRRPPPSAPGNNPSQDH